MSKPVLTCWGGVGAVTGANFLLEVGEEKYLIDCGILQGLPTADATNAEKFDYDVASIAALFVTHAHADHIGKIPKLVKDGFKGTIYSTPETKEIAKLMLADMAKINEENAQLAGTKPLYTFEDVGKAFSVWQTIKYHKPQSFGDCTVELFNSGHILGSCMYQFTFASGKKMMFTGDLGNSPSPILPPTGAISDLSYLLMDSVYGDRNHQPPAERDASFKALIEKVIADKKTLLVPIFSLERTQVILYELNELFEKQGVPEVPVYLDSPLAIRVTQVYESVQNMYNTEVESEIRSGDDVFKFKKLFETASGRDSRQIELVPGPKIILAGSGMSTAGRILNHEIKYLPDPNATLLMVGYQAPGTLGRQIQDGMKKVKIDDQEVKVNATIVTIDGFSAHKDSDHLVEFVAETKDTLKQVFVTMGEPKSSIFLAQRLHDELDVNAIVPERGKRYELDL